MDTILGMTVPAAQMKMPLAPHLTVEKHGDFADEAQSTWVVEYAGGEGSARRASEACDIVKELCPDVKTRTLRMPSSSKPTNLFRLRIDGKTVEQSTATAPFYRRSESRRRSPRREGSGGRRITCIPTSVRTSASLAVRRRRRCWRRKKICSKWTEARTKKRIDVN